MKIVTLTFVFALFSYMANAQYWGVGLRLGDPTGITAKKYLGNDKALEIVVGRTAL